MTYDPWLVEPGFYWIILNQNGHNSDWTIAELREDAEPRDRLWVVDNLNWYRAADVVEVGDRILPPEDAPAPSEDRPRRRIPIAAAKRIANDYGWDQVMIYARRCDDNGGEHVTTYGINRAHCSAAAKIGNWLKEKAGWKL